MFRPGNLLWSGKWTTCGNLLYALPPPGRAYFFSRARPAVSSERNELCVSSLVPLFSITVLAKGLSFEIVRGGDNETEGENGLSMPGMFRQEEKDGQIGILRLDKELMISINSEKKTYTEATFKELEAKVKQRRFRPPRKD